MLIQRTREKNGSGHTYSIETYDIRLTKETHVNRLTRKTHVNRLTRKTHVNRLTRKTHVNRLTKETHLITLTDKVSHAHWQKDKQRLKSQDLNPKRHIEIAIWKQTW